jgi:autophagy-related protein 2
MEVHVIGGNVRMDAFSLDAPLTSRLSVAVDTFEVRDCIESSPYNKFVCYDEQRHGKQRIMNTADISVVMSNVRMHEPAREEARLSLAVQPLRLNVDQDAVEFFIDFFGPSPPTPLSDDGSDELASSSSPPPPPSASNAAAAAAALKQAAATAVEQQLVAFIQLFEIEALHLRVDYKPKRVNYSSLRHGDFAQLVHLFPLENVALELKHAKLRGILGWDQVGAQLAEVWVNNIVPKQLHQYLAGVQPIRSVVNLGAGAADLVLLPLQTYRKSGGVLRGVAKGVGSFLQRVSAETVTLAAQLTHGTQAVLESVDDLLTGGGSGSGSRNGGDAKSATAAAATAVPSDASYRSRMASQPQGYKQGFRQAFSSLARGLHHAMHGIVVVPHEDWSRGRGAKAMLRSVLQAIPAAVLRPMIGATEAVSTALLGVKNSIEPKRYKDDNDKYKPSKRLAQQ